MERVCVLLRSAGGVVGVEEEDVVEAVTSVVADGSHSVVPVGDVLQVGLSWHGSSPPDSTQ